MRVYSSNVCCTWQGLAELPIDQAFIIYPMDCDDISVPYDRLVGKTTLTLEAKDLSIDMMPARLAYRFRNGWNFVFQQWRRGEGSYTSMDERVLFLSDV